ncbi:MAG: hypothetical protein WBE88_10480, partial [Candidatus Acidiferrales bacterium]
LQSQPKKFTLQTAALRLVVPVGTCGSGPAKGRKKCEEKEQFLIAVWKIRTRRNSLNLKSGHGV